MSPYRGLIGTTLCLTFLLTFNSGHALEYVKTRQQLDEQAMVTQITSAIKGLKDLHKLDPGQQDRVINKFFDQAYQIKDTFSQANQQYDVYGRKLLQTLQETINGCPGANHDLRVQRTEHAALRLLWDLKFNALNKSYVNQENTLTFIQRQREASRLADRELARIFGRPEPVMQTSTKFASKQLRLRPRYQGFFTTLVNFLNRPVFQPKNLHRTAPKARWH